MIAADPIAILRQALAWLRTGERVALVTLTHITGSASRRRGSQMAVAASGARIGSFSGGCIEDAVAGEALAALAERRGRTTRYGAGSPYLDVRLPCGGGIDLTFTPDPDADVLADALRRLETRQKVTLAITPGGLSRSGAGSALHLAPPLRIIACGQGEDFTALVGLARHWGAAVEAFTPAAADVAALGGDATHLPHFRALPALAGDEWTAIALLFHDRDWEAALLPGLLEVSGFYHGAVGSRATHAARLARLAEGVDAAKLAGFRGPVGLIPASRDPATLALSLLAELVAAYEMALTD